MLVISSGETAGYITLFNTSLYGVSQKTASYITRVLLVCCDSISQLTINFSNISKKMNND